MLDGEGGVGGGGRVNGSEFTTDHIIGVHKFLIYIAVLGPSASERRRYKKTATAKPVLNGVVRCLLDLQPGDRGRTLFGHTRAIPR